jgi:DNA-binding transcriptional regulator GbsR (MarR family)
MKSINLLMAMALLLSISTCFAEIKNAKVETVHIYGNCSICKSTIETAANVKNVVQVEWNKDTKMAVLTYDEKQTNQDEILKRIGLAGYDSDKFLAPDNVYAKLETCCQYERAEKIIAKIEVVKAVNLAMEEKVVAPILETKTEVVLLQLKEVFDSYFAVKDALVKTDGNLAATKAVLLLNSINAVKMENLTKEEHAEWMKVMKDLVFDAEHISETKDAGHQRDHFTSLSKNMYSLIKVSKQETPTYYQFCPMANKGKGANWLSKENIVKNPYYGSKMLGCGKTVETIN